MIEFAIGFGIVLNLISYELIGLTAGGAVIPGYLALFLDQPGRIVSTLIAAAVTLLIVRGLSNGMILYGRRKFAVTLLVGFAVNAMFNVAAPGLSGLLASGLPEAFTPLRPDVRVIGFIVPGLLANEMYNQGVLRTGAISLVAAVVVRIGMMLLVGLGVGGGV